PVREALRRLAYDGLVHIAANSSAIVAELSLRDFLEITAVRELLEPYVAATAIGRIDPALLDDLESTFRRLQDLPRGDEADRTLNEEENKLHNALGEATGNRRIATIMDNLYVMIHRYRYLSAARVYDESIAEHLAIIAAMR